MRHSVSIEVHPIDPAVLSQRPLFVSSTQSKHLFYPAFSGSKDLSSKPHTPDRSPNQFDPAAFHPPDFELSVSLPDSNWFRQFSAALRNPA
ncbi:hypothetical protein D3C71_1206740 [compost metagenome]